MSAVGSSSTTSNNLPVPGAASTSSATSSGPQSAANIQADYLNLLITQLKNQDPANPMDSSQMASQLTQLSELQQVQNMNTTMQQVLSSQKMSQATSLLGTTVSYTMSGDSTVRSGTVDRVDVIDGAVNVHVGGNEVDPANIQSVTVSGLASTPSTQG